MANDSLKMSCSVFKELYKSYSEREDSQLKCYSNEELIILLPDHQELLDYFISKNENMLWRIVHKFLDGRDIGRDEAFMQELFQVAVIKFFQCYDKYNPELGFKFSTFAYSAILNSLKNYCRGQWREECKEDEELEYRLPPAESFEDSVLDKEWAKSLYQSLATLENIERAVLCLRFDLDSKALETEESLIPYIIQAQTFSSSKKQNIYNRAIRKLSINTQSYSLLIDAYKIYAA